MLQSHLSHSGVQLFYSNSLLEASKSGLKVCGTAVSVCSSARMGSWHFSVKIESPFLLQLFHNSLAPKVQTRLIFLWRGRREGGDGVIFEVFAAMI